MIIQCRLLHVVDDRQPLIHGRISACSFQRLVCESLTYAPRMRWEEGTPLNSGGLNNYPANMGSTACNHVVSLGGFKHLFMFTPNLGKWSNLTSICCNWVIQPPTSSTNTTYYARFCLKRQCFIDSRSSAMVALCVYIYTYDIYIYIYIYTYFSHRIHGIVN